MEYMVSGTPVLTTKLPGMPKEYYKYIFLIEDESEDGMRNSMLKVLSLSKEELIEVGKMARQFVLNNKNNNMQAEKIIKLSTKIMENNISYRKILKRD